MHQSFPLFLKCLWYLKVAVLPSLLSSCSAPVFRTPFLSCWLVTWLVRYFLNFRWLLGSVLCQCVCGPESLPSGHGCLLCPSGSPESWLELSFGVGFAWKDLSSLHFFGLQEMEPHFPLTWAKKGNMVSFMGSSEIQVRQRGSLTSSLTQKLEGWLEHCQSFPRLSLPLETWSKPICLSTNWLHTLFYLLDVAHVISPGFMSPSFQLHVEAEWNLRASIPNSWKRISLVHFQLDIHLCPSVVKSVARVGWVVKQ